MSGFLLRTRYLILIPILGLAIGAAFYFVFGGFGLLEMLFRLLPELLRLTEETEATEPGVVTYQVVEYVHAFLVGTVLYITAVGLYQLFIQEIDFPKWLKINSTEQLETNLIGVTVVVLSVNFMGKIFLGDTDKLLEHGAGIAMPTAALGLFVGLRAWAVAQIAKAEVTAEDRSASRPTEVGSSSGDPS